MSKSSSIGGAVVVVVVLLVGSMIIVNSARLGYSARAYVSEGVIDIMPSLECLGEYFESHKAFPDSKETCELPESKRYVATYSNGKVKIDYSFEARHPEASGSRDISGSLVFTPYTNTNNELSWKCLGGNLANDYRPTKCSVE